MYGRLHSSQGVGIVTPPSDTKTTVAAPNRFTFVREGGLVERLPIPPGARGAIRGALQTRQGLGALPIPLGIAGAVARYDALLFNTPGLCRSAPDLIERMPTVLVTDVTPKQLVEMED